MRCVLRTALTRMLDLAAKWMKTKLSLLRRCRCDSPPVLELDLAAKWMKTKLGCRWDSPPVLGLDLAAKSRKTERSLACVVNIYNAFRAPMDVYGHTTLNLPVLVRSPKSSNVGRG